MKNRFRSSTALVLSLSLVVGPLPVVAQDDPPVCDLAAPDVPCTLDGALIEAIEDLPAAPIDEPASEPVEALVEETAPEAQLEDAPEAPSTDDASPTQAPAEDAAVEEAPVEQELEEAPEEEIVTEEAPAEEVMTEEVNVTEAPAEAEAPLAEEIEAEEAPAQEIQTGETSTEQPASEEASTDVTSGDAVAVEDAPAVEATAEEEAAPENTEVDTAAESLPEETAPAPGDTVQDAPASAAATADAETEADVIDEEVAEGDVRTASEDFETAVNGDATVAPRDDDSGLSNFEKAVLVGLGALAIGSILDNGDEVVSNSGDRIILQDPNGQLRVLKDDDVLLRQPGSNVRTQQFSDGSSRTTVIQPDGREIVTIRASDGRVLRRALINADGSQTVLFDDTQVEQTVDVTTLPSAVQQPTTSASSEDELRTALEAELRMDLDRTFSLRQVRVIKEVRELAPEVELDAITFASGSAAIQPDQARELAILGQTIKAIIDARPATVFLIEGHTDAVGSATYNLALSDRRAETVALALAEYFEVPTVNLVTQGYGEANLKVRTLADEQANRRAVVRNITGLLQ